jgi:linoleoyl-CoA desaturase
MTAVPFSAPARALPPPSRPTFLSPRPAPSHLSEEERLRGFADELDAIKARALARVGSEDVAYVRRLNLLARAMEVAGRVLIHLSAAPLTWIVGVLALWINKQLQATEIGHTALHGAYDRLPGGERFASRTFRWDTPIDEDSWKKAHNVRHHGHTNVYGRDPDVNFGPVRLTDKTPWNARHRWQLPFALGIVFPFFAFVINTHVTGLSDAWLAKDGDQPYGNLPDGSDDSVRTALKRALRKYLPYYAYNFALFPVLAALTGHSPWKVLAAALLVEVLRDVYSACTIFCGHVGHDVKSWPESVRAHGRGQWYAMQVESTNDFEVSLPVSILCGGLDRQIEHHLFPTLAPPRLREIAHEVRAACERWGVQYKTDTWGRTLRKAMAHIRALARQGGVYGVVREMS